MYVEYRHYSSFSSNYLIIETGTKYTAYMYQEITSHIAVISYSHPTARAVKI